MTQPATVGSDLLYTYAASDQCKAKAVGQSRPAKVVRSWGSCYNVQVFTDGQNDFDDKRLVLHLTSIQISDCIAKGRLHWAGSSVESESVTVPIEHETEPLPEFAEPGVVEPEQIQTTIAPPSVLKKKAGRPKKATKA